MNHLSFADDVIVFTPTCKYSLKLIIKIFNYYEVTSGQLINKYKINFRLLVILLNMWWIELRVLLIFVRKIVLLVTLDAFFTLEDNEFFFTGMVI